MVGWAYLVLSMIDHRMRMSLSCGVKCAKTLWFRRGWDKIVRFGEPFFQQPAVIIYRIMLYTHVPLWLSLVVLSYFGLVPIWFPLLVVQPVPDNFFEREIWIIFCGESSLLRRKFKLLLLMFFLWNLHVTQWNWVVNCVGYLGIFNIAIEHGHL